MFEPAALSARLEQIILANAKRTFLTVERTHPGWHAIAQKPPRSDFGAYPCFRRSAQANDRTHCRASLVALAWQGGS